MNSAASPLVVVFLWRAAGAELEATLGSVILSRGDFLDQSNHCCQPAPKPNGH